MVFEILNPAFNGVYLVDEIERSIHPHLLKEIIKKLVNSEEIKGLVFYLYPSDQTGLIAFSTKLLSICIWPWLA